MKKQYTIGEVSKIMGISTQTLRYYSSIDLLKPDHINPDTGYRYYSSEQFHFIDRIRYLQKLGMSLEEIREILVNNDIQSLIHHLEELEANCQSKIDELQDTLDTVRWYRNYFTESEESDQQQYSYVQHFPERYMVAVDINPDEDKDNYHVRLTTLRNESFMQNLPYMRQYSVIMDYDALLDMNFKPLSLGMFIKSFSRDMRNYSKIRPYIRVIPEGDYFCFRSRIQVDGWNPYLIKMFFSERDRKPHLVLANEFEDNLKEYHRCPYEVQILIEPEQA